MSIEIFRPTIKPSVRKVTVTLPIDLLDRLAEYIPARARSEFIKQAVEEKLELVEQAAAIEEAIGIWSDENHPELDSEEAIEQWIRTLRGSWHLTEVSKHE